MSRPPNLDRPAPAATQPAGIPEVVEHLADLSPAQRLQLRALVAHALAIAASNTHPDELPLTNGEAAEPERSPLSEPGVLIVLLMLAFVALVALVALATVFGLSIARA